MWTPDVEVHASGWPALLLVVLFTFLTIDAAATIGFRLVEWLSK